MRAAGATATSTVDLPRTDLPAYLIVRWTAADGGYQATWTANVADRSALPPPTELAALSIEVVLAALASNRPLPVALEQELRRRESHGDDGDGWPDFDDSELLLQRTRRLSLSLWRLEERLGRPATSLEALRWRLDGPFGPRAIADGLVAASTEERALPGEAHFLLAELALMVINVDWSRLGSSVDAGQARKLVDDLIDDLAERQRELPPPPDPAIDGYVRDALEAARR